MKAQSEASRNTRTYRSCLTREKWSQDMSNIAGDQKNCTQTILTSTGSKIAMNVQCKDQDMKSQMHLEFEAASSGKIKGAGHVVITVGNRTTASDSIYTGTWIGAACGTVH
jgi:hypothetical protein